MIYITGPHQLSTSAFDYLYRFSTKIVFSLMETNLYRLLSIVLILDSRRKNAVLDC